MLPLLDAEVVSPELALVDPELAGRARAALPPRCGRRVPAPSLPTVAVAPATRRGRRLATPVLTVLATAAASAIVTAFTSFEQAQGEPPRAVASVETVAPITARAAPEGSRAVATPPARSDAPAAASSPSSPTASGRVGTDGGRTRAKSAALPMAAASRTTAPARSGTTLVWDEAAGAAAYDVELRRGGALIYAATFAAREALVPRSWEKDGTAFVLQPEDQLYVWPVIGGRRASPVVDGALAMDTTDIARFVELSQSSQP
jgi:hypothetical protein